MPTGTRSSISANSTMKPVTATSSALIRAASFDGLDAIAADDELGAEDEAPGADGDQDDRRGVARPGDGEERPGRQVEIVGQDVVGIGRPHLVEEGRRLHAYHQE